MLLQVWSIQKGVGKEEDARGEDLKLETYQ